MSAHCLDPSLVQNRLSEVEVIDVRTPGEFEAIHIPSSRNLPLDELEEHAPEIRELVEQGAEVVLTCRSGARAHQAQERLTELGLPDLRILEGGMVAWEQAGAPVVQDVMRWDLERQVRFVAGLIVALSVLVSIAVPEARFVAGAVGLGLVVASLTNTCAMGMVLSKLPYNQPRSARV